MGPRQRPTSSFLISNVIFATEGRIDNSYRIELVKTQDARDAIDALLYAPGRGGHSTPGFSVALPSGREKSAARLAAWVQKLETRARDPGTGVERRIWPALRTNPTHKMIADRFLGDMVVAHA